MRSDLDHLPEAKRRELKRVVQILFEEFEAATANRSHQHLKRGRILKVVLFGSYARGDWAGSGARTPLVARAHCATLRGEASGGMHANGRGFCCDVDRDVG